MKWLTNQFGRHADIAMVALVLGILLVLFAPIPKALLDLLILCNFAFAFLLLMLTFYVARPVDFSTFPSLLLIATLFRLGLNVAATRLILTDADAGRVIAAIGSYVAGNNYVIGLIIFLILIVVQYVVVTNGAQRVSEVAARFTLDSMPGQQMSIDADLNMGFIDQVEAQRRRKNLEKEAAFYGAMDGASKFVKGDAVAGILILSINIVGGLVIGVLQQKASWSQALQTYTLLTIGDGIVTQVPALVIAVGTGIIVTRSASDSQLSAQIVRQATAFPKALVLVATAVFGIGLLPGIPFVPMVAVVAAVLVVAWLAATIALPGAAAQAEREAAEAAASGSTDKARAAGAAPFEPVEVHLGRALTRRFDTPGDDFLERVNIFRQQYAEEIGLTLPRVKFQASDKLADEAYEISVDGVRLARGQVHLDKLLAIHADGSAGMPDGEAIKDPAYGLPAAWIRPDQHDAATTSRITAVDGPTVLLTHLTEVLRRESATLLSRGETEKLLARVRTSQPGLVEELIPTVLAVTDVQKVLQALLKEKVSIRNLDAILETLADAGRATKDVAQLVERVRQRLGPAICRSLTGDTTTLTVITLDPVVESQILAGLRQSQEGGTGFAIEPSTAERLISRVVQVVEKSLRTNQMPVLLCSPDLRRHMRALLERVVPHMRVLALTEIPNFIELKADGVISL